MIDRKAIRRSAWKTLKGHYALLVFLCAIAILWGTEYNGVTKNAQTFYDLVTGRQTQVDLGGLRDDGSMVSQTLDEILGTRVNEDYAESAERMEAMKSETDPKSALGRQRGVLAAAMNYITSGHLSAMTGMAFYRVFQADHIASVILILVSAFLYALVWVFLKKIYSAILRRAFLEARTYRAFPLSHLFHIKSVGRWTRASLTLLLAAIYQALWEFTIVGGVIKHYSYFAVPFIVAENPDIKPQDAIKLSRRMMNGHKWECFLLGMSFLGWRLLGFLTFGVVEIFWVLPYRVAAYAEYYAKLRALAKAAAIPGVEALNDDCLFAPADAKALQERYAEIVRLGDIIEEDIVDLSPKRRFFAQNFGIWLGSQAEKIVYSRQEGLRQQTVVARQELCGDAYPERLNPLWNKKRDDMTRKISYLSPCTVWSLIAVFFAFCMFGWVWEVTLNLIINGTFVNRGALHGPWLPIYGSGVVMIAVLLYRLRKRPALEAAAIVVLCGLLEYFTSYFMELANGMRWWDYTGYFLNLNGRICGEGLAVFGIGGMAAIYLLIPLIDAFVTRIKPRVLIPVCLALLVCFCGDWVYSQFVPNVGEGITDIGQPTAETASNS